MAKRVNCFENLASKGGWNVGSRFASGNVTVQLERCTLDGDLGELYSCVSREEFV